MDIQKERKAFENWWEAFHNDRQIACDYVEEDNSYSVGYANAQWVAWQAAKAQAMPKYNKYFSYDGNNYEVHDTLAEAKQEAERAIEYFRDCLTDQRLDPECDGNFQRVSYGVVLAESGYSVEHVVTQEDVDNSTYPYEVGTEIMSLFLTENQSTPEGFVLLPIEPSKAIKAALSYQCFDFIKIAQIYRECGFDIPKKAEDEQSFFLHKFLLLAIKHGGDFIKAFNPETKAMIEAQESKKC